jgi:glycosyltransferase involved in cell wall biosynthesis
MLGMQTAKIEKAGPFRHTVAPQRVVVINDFSAQGGGATAIAIASARLLAERGIPVSYLAGDDGKGIAGSHRLIDVAAFCGRHIISGSRMHAAARGLYDVSAAAFISSWIARNDTPGTIYHLHGWSKILSPSAFHALRPIADRLVVSAHDYFLVCPNGGYFNFRSGQPCEIRPMSARCLTTPCDRRSYSHKVWRFARHSLTRTICDGVGTAGAIVAVHEGMAQILVRGGIPAAKITVLRNAVTPWRRERITAEKNSVFFFVGRLESDKGVELLARACTRAGARLCVIGGGPLAGVLAKEFPQVAQLGWKHSVEIAEYIGAARALVMPSRYREPFGLVALEAMMSGLPVLVSDQSLIANEVQASGFGISCDPHDEERFTAALARLQTDDALVERMSRKAHAESRRLAPTSDEWVSDLIAVYSGLLRRKSADERRRSVGTARLS